MYEVFRVAFDGNGQPMRLTVTAYPQTAISLSSTSAMYPSSKERPHE